jgi:hypothetical protein
MAKFADATMTRLRSVAFTPLISLRAVSPDSSTLLGPPRTRDRKSGAMAMKPSAATWSATPRTQVESPNISCTTTTTGALARLAGYTTQAMIESGDPGSHGNFTHSACLGLALSRASAFMLLGGNPGAPCFALETAAGARTSAALMCAA